MLSFPKGAKVNEPAGTFLDGQCSVSVRIHTEDDVPRLKEMYGRRLSNFEIDGESLRNLEFVRALAGMRVRILLADSGLFETGETVDALFCTEPVFAVKPDANLIRNLNFLTSLNFRVHIESGAAVQAEDSLLHAVDFYLHNPLLTTPVEPFHSLLHTVSRGRGYSMWDVEGENARTSFYVSDNGEVSLSKRWNIEGLNYGTLDDPWKKFVNSDLFRRLSAFRSELFRNKSSCVFCAHMDLCGGFLRAIDPDWPCELWQQVFLTLRGETQRAMQLQQETEQRPDQQSDT